MSSAPTAGDASNTAAASKARGSKQQRRPKVQFKLVQQSYEDKDYEGAPKPVLVPAALVDQRFKKRRKDHPAFIFGEDMPEDFSNRRNMLMTDDTRPGEECLFDDEVEEEFDETFIHEMMYGDVDDDEKEYFDDDDDGEGMDEEAYPTHDVTQRALDKQFTKMMREFEVDEDINDAFADDPRTHGPLEVDQYMAALEEFVEENAGYSMDTAEPIKNKGLINQMKKLAHRNRIFDSNKDGVFVTTLLPDKTARFMAEFKQQSDEIHRKAKEAYEEKLRREAENPPQASSSATDGLDAAGGDEEEAEEEDKDEYEVVALKRRDRVDCETVLSTYSTLYNHPNVIAASRKKIHPEKALAMERRRQEDERLAKQEQMQQQHKKPKVEEEEEEDDEDEEDEDATNNDALQQALDAGIDLTVRPKDESNEEKKLRRQLVKQLQRDKRQQKKALKTAYKDASLTQQIIAPISKQAKKEMSLSMVARAR